jgi:hypothetical protein
MKFAAVILAAFLVAGFNTRTHAQVTFNGTYQVTPVNGGTGSIVSVPIGQSGLSVSVGTGSAALPLQNIAGAQGATHYNLGDDSGVNVPLGFNFPYWGQSFNNSWMYSNGIVSFANGNLPGAGCCGGQNLATLASQRNTTYNYMIAPLWTDLIDTTGQSTWVLKNSSSATYGWYNTKEYGTNNSSSFEVNINATGAMSVRYGGAFVSTGHTVTAGMTGNLANGEYFQYYTGQGFNIPTANPVSWGTAGTYDQCLVNPLSSLTCPGYTAAYTTQQCSISALYDTSCPGYAAAYTTQQCNLNQLYSTSCSGYQDAYLSQQCSLDTLYSSSCPGYATAYHNHQCSLNQLYATDCPGYAAAYLEQQCTANPLYSTTCSGYATAYHNQQCSLNPLFATDCTGYATAYHNQQCSINTLYMSDCPGYQQAYFSQQCSLNGLYDRACPNYADAYARANILNITPTASTTVTPTATPIATAAAVAATTTTMTSDPVAALAPAIADPVVNNVVSVAKPSAASAETSPAAAVKLTAPAPAAVATVAQADNKKEDKKEEVAKNGNSNTSNTPSADTKPSDQPKSNREALQERRAEAAKKEAVAKGKDLANEMGKASDMEAQKAVQNVVIQAMGFTPGFDVYNNLRLPDVQQFYKPYQIYGGQVNVDNKNISRRLLGGSDRVHQDMVDSQYNRGN